MSDIYSKQLRTCHPIGETSGVLHVTAQGYTPGHPRFDQQGTAHPRNALNRRVHPRTSNEKGQHPGDSGIQLHPRMLKS